MAEEPSCSGTRGCGSRSVIRLKGLEDGQLKFILHGEKLQGAWMLVRKGGRRAEEGERRWFLFKERDEFARPGKSITEDMPLSVATGRDLNEIAERSDRVWGPGGEDSQNSRTTTSEAAVKKKPSRRSGKSKPAGSGRSPKRRVADRSNGTAKTHENAQAESKNLERLLKHPKIRRGRLPQSQKVELATLVDAAPPGDDWLHEIKFDGYRMICRVDKGKAAYQSKRSRLDFKTSGTCPSRRRFGR